MVAESACAVREQLIIDSNSIGVHLHLVAWKSDGGFEQGRSAVGEAPAVRYRRLREVEAAALCGQDSMRFASHEIDLAREFHNQIIDVNREPGCTDTFGSVFDEKESRVFKIGEEDKGLTLVFNAEDRTAEIKGTAPIKFHYFIQVRLAQNETKWYYAGGETDARYCRRSCAYHRQTR